MQQVLVVNVPAIPGDLWVYFDDQPDGLVIWVREGLSAGERACAMTQALAQAAMKRYWERSSRPGNSALPMAG